MHKNTTVSLGDHFDRFIARQVKSGRYDSASEVLRDGLRLLEKQEQQRSALRRALIAGETSGIAGTLDVDRIKQNGRKHPQEKRKQA